MRKGSFHACQNTCVERKEGALAFVDSKFSLFQATFVELPRRHRLSFGGRFNDFVFTIP